MSEAGIIKLYIEKILNIPPAEQEIKDRVIIFLWNLARKKKKITLFNYWTALEDDYLKVMAGKLSYQEVYKKFKHRSKAAVRYRIWKLGLKDKYARFKSSKSL